MIVKTAIIRKEKGKYKLYSRKKNSKTGKRRLLGESDTLEGIKKREKQVQFFKFHCLDQNDRDKETKSLSLISDTAQYLENAGYIKAADKLYMAMGHIDANLDNSDDAADFIPQNQSNIENESTHGDLGLGPGTFNIQEAEKLASLANELDQKGFYEEADLIDGMLISASKEQFLSKNLSFNSHNGKETINIDYSIGDNKGQHSVHKQFKNLKEALEYFNSLDTEMNNVDLLAKLNGLDSTSVIDNQNSGMFSGLSDSYLYHNYDLNNGPYNNFDISSTPFRVNKITI